MCAVPERTAKSVTWKRPPMPCLSLSLIFLPFIIGQLSVFLSIYPLPILRNSDPISESPFPKGRLALWPKGIASSSSSKLLCKVAMPWGALREGSAQMEALPIALIVLAIQQLRLNRACPHSAGRPLFLQPNPHPPVATHRLCWEHVHVFWIEF